ncbi:hypothetical protein JXO52_11860 [bacterium]|nr:hypothetical protein [bacterium]
MKKMKIKHLIIFILSAAIIFINGVVFFQNQFKSKKTHRMNVDGLDYYNQVLEKIELVQKDVIVELPRGHASMMICLNGKRLNEINKILEKVHQSNICIDVFFIKNNIPLFYKGKVNFYSLKNIDWLQDYQLSPSDDFIFVVNDENRIEYFENFQITSHKIKLLMTNFTVEKK